MRNYRFPLLFAIGAACLGSAHNSQLLAADSLTSQLGTVATPQTVTVAAVDSPYTRYMNEGYQATEAQNYRKALDSFKKALQERPGDPYARQAVQNLQTYLDRESQWWLLVALATVAALAVGSSLFLFLRLRRRSLLSHSQAAEAALLADAESDLLEEPSEINNQAAEAALLANAESDLLEEPSAANNHQEAEIKDAKFLVEINPQPEAAVQSIIHLPNLDQIENLMEDLNDSDPKKRRKAIWELAQKSDSRSMKSLVDLMVDTDSQERSLILEALSQISTRTLKPMNQALAISLQDKNPQVRKNAIRDLTRIYDVMSQISQMLCHAIDDGDHEVKETAKWALNQINLQMPPRFDLVSQPTNPSVTVEQSYSEAAER